MTLRAKLAAGVILLAVAGCGSVSESRLNPFGWFGRDRSEDLADAARAETEAPVIDQVLSLSVDATPGGAIVSTVGLPPTQGFWEAELVRVPTEDPSVMLFDFRILPPLEPRPAGTQPSREVLAGTILSNQDLNGIRTIAVQGQRNRRSVRR